MLNVYDRFNLAYSGFCDMINIYQKDCIGSNELKEKSPSFTLTTRALGNATRGYNLSMNTDVKTKVDKVLDLYKGYFMTYSTDPKNISLALNLDSVPDVNFNEKPLFIVHKHVFAETIYGDSDEAIELADFKTAEVIVLANQVLNDSDSNILDVMEYILPSNAATITPYSDYINAYIAVLFIIQALRKLYPEAIAFQICYSIAKCILKKTGNYTKEATEELQKVWLNMFRDIFDYTSNGEVFHKILDGDFPLLRS